MLVTALKNHKAYILIIRIASMVKIKKKIKKKKLVVTKNLSASEFISGKKGKK